MELEKRTLYMNRQKARVVAQVTVDEDRNVPDAKPDLERIILQRGDVEAEELHCTEGRAMLRGKLRYAVLYAAEGGYAISRDGCDGSVVYAQHARKPEEVTGADRAAVVAPWGVSGVLALRGYDGGTVVMPEPNTNLMAPRTLLPTLTAKLEPGDHVLISAVLGTKTGGRTAWENPPTVEEIDDGKMG